jgi:hypothetical protein
LEINDTDDVKKREHMIFNGQLLKCGKKRFRKKLSESGR